MKQHNNLNGATIFFLIVILLTLGFISIDFLIGTILPTIGLFNLILIPIAWELAKTGVTVLLELIKILFQLDKFIEKDNNN